ncbi:MAG: aryl-sulfate sulfotransferase [Bryobacterales bacterium]|nr:aryl-sulfate sulfotransferase [Bryobacterales bacterium]
MNAKLAVKASGAGEPCTGKAMLLEGGVENADEPVWYRFRVRGPGEADWRMVRDYGPRNSLQWMAMGKAGVYEIEMSVRGLDSGRISSTIERQQVSAAAAAEEAAVYPTDHPLVFVYSAPACAAGSSVRVAYRGPEGKEQSTPERECNGADGVNFYLAGLRASTFYKARHVTRRGAASAEGVEIEFETPPVDLALAPVTVRKAAPASAEGALVMGTLFQVPTATDLQGNLIWYYPYDLQYLTRPVAGGYFLALLEEPMEGPEEQRFLKFDLAGYTVLETNAARINEQLAAMGRQPMTSFHHEAVELPDGRFLLLAGTERLLTDVQGEGEVDVIGDMILVLDANLQVVWAWDAFDHLDVTRAALADEKCVPGGGGCPAFYLAKQANDWLHGNSLQLTPDGNILYSARHQDWLIKIRYEHGAGDGSVMWRLGKDGDFEVEGGGEWPWFSHQHDGSQLDERHVLVFDNGNTRREFEAGANSRGQMFEIDEAARKAKLVLNADLGAYAFALGSAQLLPNGNYHFNLGWMPNAASQALEFTRSGELVYQIETGIQQYRSFRMADLYTP